jgi:methyl-accepting chemotaxis protein
MRVASFAPSEDTALISLLNYGIKISWKLFGSALIVLMKKSKENDAMNTAKKSMSLTTTLALAFFILSVAVLLTSGIVQIISYYRTQQETVASRQRLIASDPTNQVASFIQTKLSIMETVAMTSSIASDSRLKQKELLSGLLGLQSAFHHVAIFDVSGRLVAGSSRLSQLVFDKFVSGLPPDIFTGFKQGDKYISKVYFDEMTREPMVTLAIADKTGLGVIRDVLVCEATLKFMWDVLGNLKVGDTGYAYVVDRSGTMIAFRDSSRVLKEENVTKVKPVADFLRDIAGKGASGISTYQGIMGTSVVGTYVPLKTPDWAVVVELPVREAYKEVGSTVLSSIIIILVMAVLAGFVGIVLARRLAVPLVDLTTTASMIAGGNMSIEASIAGSKEIASLGKAFNSMTTQLKTRMDGFRRMNETLGEIVSASKGIVVNINSSATEIEAASLEQTSASNEHASGITEVSATLQELSITAKQITNNIGELVYSSEKTITLLKESEKQLLGTLSQLEDAGQISRDNTMQINELGKRSILINEMVELIRNVANKTNILSINASIEASRSGEAGAGFSVVAAEIRELSKETINSAKKAEVAAKEINKFLSSIIASSENESDKVVGSGKSVKAVVENVGSIVSKINDNYGFTQKINMSIKQQENGSVQAAETIRQMAEIARQFAQTARQTLEAVKNIVALSAELESKVNRVKKEDADA